MLPNGTVTTISSVIAPGQDGETATGVNVLLVIIYGSLIILVVGIFGQRFVQRIAPKFSKGYTDVGKYAPKALKEDIDKRLMQTLHVVYEPRLLLDDDERNLCLNSKNNDEENQNAIPYNYLYRMKAVDDIKRLEEALCRTDESLKRHPLKDFKQHLKDVKSHSSGVMRTVRSNQMKALTEGYEHARYKPEPFGKREYEKFKDALNDVISGVEHKSKKKRMKKQHSQKNTNNSSNEASSSHKDENDSTEIYSENEPLISEKNPDKKDQ